MNAGLFAVQDALYTALAAEPALQLYLGNPARIYDHVPPDASFPFLTCGAVQAESYDTSDHQGLSQQMVLHVWSRERGRKETKLILDALYQKLHLGSLTISGQKLLLCRFRSASIELDDDGLTYHGIAIYQFITQNS